ncbi:N-acetyltransferase family protein [Cytobacillus horneckiae]|uniref:GNAT family N-acetyltransferase n=1 Tax=Cytobacillus horneckiae TaxID=549687 RepID=UPI003D9A9218
MGQFVYKNFRMLDGRKFAIRTATSDDAEKVLLYTKDITEDSPFLLFEKGEFNLTIDQNKIRLEDFFHNENKLAILAEVDDEVIGFLDFSNGNRERLKHQGSFGMSVAKTYRSKSVGKALLSSLIYWCKQNQMIEKINLEVMSQNLSALRLYESAGFEREGIKRREVKYKDGNYEDLILMAYFLQ